MSLIDMYRRISLTCLQIVTFQWDVSCNAGVMVDLYRKQDSVDYLAN